MVMSPSAAMPDQIVIDGCLLVQAVVTKGVLVVSRGYWHDAHSFLFDPRATSWITPGKPLKELTPLKEHEPEIRALVLRSMSVMEATPKIRRNN